MPDHSARLLRRWVLPCVALLLIVLFHHSPFGRALDRAFFDGQSRHPFRAAPLPAVPSAIVLIDEQTMNALDRDLPAMRWPFPRYAFAGLIAALDRAGAETIVMDFTFFDPSDNTQDDLLFAGVASATPNLVLARTPAQVPVFWREEFLRENGIALTPPRLGDVTFHADEDGVARTYQPENSLAAAALNQPLRMREGLLRWHGGLGEIQAKSDDHVQVISARPFLAAGLAIMKRISDAAPDLEPAAIVQALRVEGALSGGAFDAVKGRTVFVGANVSGTFDVKATPVEKLAPGVLVHWTAWSNLATTGLTVALPRWSALLLGLALGGVILSASLWRPGLGFAGSVTIVAIGSVLAAAFILASFGLFFPPMTPIAAASLTLLGVSAESFWRERQRKREIQAMFGSYVAPSVVEQLVRDPQAIRLGGERREATVFFCDLAGFTDLSEKVSPELLLQIINRYLQETSDSLLAHGAYIDKYIGDAVMAIFGVPNPLPHHALAACEGALAASRAFARFSDEVAREHGHRPRMRIGINTGEMIVGNLGSERKMNYTVLGDAVNLASRLEGANKEFGTAIMLGPETARLVAEQMVTRPLSRLRVKGKQEAVEVHELIGRIADISPAQQEFVTMYTHAYRHFAAREFAVAAEGFARAQTCAPAGERLTHLLWQHALAHAAQPPPPSWEPIISLDSK